MARRLRLNSRMGLTSGDEAINQQVPGFSGPGAARVGYSEFNQRDWLTLWSSHLAGSAPTLACASATSSRPRLTATHWCPSVDARPSDDSYEPALPFDDPRHLAASRFLVEEAAILDAGEWATWLGLLTDDVRYVMPVRVTTVHDAGYDSRGRHGPLRRGPLRHREARPAAAHRRTPGRRTRRRGPATS